MALAGLPLLWIFVRVLLDMRDCRIAAALLVSSAASYGLSTAGFLDFVPAVEDRLGPIITAVSLLLGHWLLFTAIVANARFVVLDAQGLVAVRRQSNAKRAASATAKQAAYKTAQASATTNSTSATVSLSRETVQTAKTPADSSRWVDGTRFEREHYDADEDDEESSDGERKLSKSDRKKLRKIKTQGRAA
jgi:hypothetical protein